LLQVAEPRTTVLEAFRMADEVLTNGVSGITDLITTPGLINVDFADVKAVMEDAGSAVMGIGRGSGEHRAKQAAEKAIASPLLETSMDGARGVLLSIAGPSDMTLMEVNDAATVIADHSDSDANVIFGATIDDALGEEVRVTVIAAGFERRPASRPGLFSEPSSRVSLPEATMPGPAPAAPAGEDLDIPEFVQG
jgi:cell division protein FtsZ